MDHECYHNGNELRSNVVKPLDVMANVFSGPRAF